MTKKQTKISALLGQPATAQMQQLSLYVNDYMHNRQVINNLDFTSLNDPKIGTACENCIVGVELRNRFGKPISMARIKNKDLPLHAKKNSLHQYRIKKKVKKKASQILANTHVFSQTFTDFESLYAHVEQLLKVQGGLTGIGPLFIYDVALRVGYLLNPQVKPANYVYLQAGAWVGAKKLEQAGIIQPVYGRKVPISHFTSILPFAKMTAYEIEDFLCVFHSVL